MKFKVEITLAYDFARSVDTAERLPITDQDNPIMNGGWTVIGLGNSAGQAFIHACSMIDHQHPNEFPNAWLGQATRFVTDFSERRRGEYGYKGTTFSSGHRGFTITLDRL